MRRRTVLGSLVAAPFAGALLADPAAADVSTTIDPRTDWGAWEGWGTSLCWWGKAYGNRDDLADIFFTRNTVQYQGQALPGLGLNIDIEKGVFDRFRTLPVWRPSALVGMIFGDVLRYILAATTIMIVGLILGFRPDGGVPGVLAGIGLLVVFSFAFSWVWTMFGLFLRSEKSVMGVSMLVLFPLTFLSNVFVEPSTMPGWLQAFVEVNPISHLVTAVRSMMAGAWDMGEVAWTLVASAALVVVFGALTMRLYNRK